MIWVTIAIAVAVIIAVASVIVDELGKTKQKRDED